jgi:hypothetical protein
MPVEAIVGSKMSRQFHTGLLCASVLLGAAPALAAPPPVIQLSVPGEAREVPTNTEVFYEDLVFTTGGATAPLMGYDVFLQITGPTSNLTIVGVGTGSDRPANAVFADDPSFTAYPTFYGISDVVFSGSPTITDGSVLARVKFQALAGTTGTYNVNWVFSSPYTSQLYQDDLTPPTPVSGATFVGGTITFAVPEPASLGLLGAGACLLLSRRKRSTSSAVR